MYSKNVKEKFCKSFVEDCEELNLNYVDVLRNEKLFNSLSRKSKFSILNSTYRCILYGNYMYRYYNYYEFSDRLKNMYSCLYNGLMK